jgi:hypothetical protein
MKNESNENFNSVPQAKDEPESKNSMRGFSIFAEAARMADESMNGFNQSISEPETEFQQWDIVSRDGTDEHLIYEPVDDWGNISVVCIKEPKISEGNTEPWTKIGETESNLARRYDFIAKSQNPEQLLYHIGRLDLFNPQPEKSHPGA